MSLRERVEGGLARRPIILQFLRFAAIGFLNTAIDFAVLNLLISLTGITNGFGISVLDAISFAIAVFHSYYWNKFWAFGESHKRSLVYELLQLLSVSIIGGAVIVLAVMGAHSEAPFYYFILVALGMLAAEFVVWNVFEFNRRIISNDPAEQSQQVVAFFVVSIIGTILNSALVGLFTTFIALPVGINSALWVNGAKIVATVLSLVWNFIGYKIFVFKTVK